MDSIERREFWTQAAVVAVLIILAVAAFVTLMLQPISPDDVKIAASSLRSSSSVTRQLLEQYQRGEVSKKYYETHLELLEDSVKSEYDALNTTSVDDTVRSELAEARDLAFDFDGILKRLTGGSADIDESRTDALSFTQQFATIEERARQIAETE